MRISDWSSDGFSADLLKCQRRGWRQAEGEGIRLVQLGGNVRGKDNPSVRFKNLTFLIERACERQGRLPCFGRSEEHTSELQSLMRISYAVFCLKKKKQHKLKIPLVM